MGTGDLICLERRALLGRGVRTARTGGVSQVTRLVRGKRTRQLLLTSSRKKTAPAGAYSNNSDVTGGAAAARYCYLAGECRMIGA
jgi:hypothetical protein